ncbi:MAG: hypothetical protein F4W90_03745 [Gammaproteobacteria bacterium]|nr:hypothetical protein [Gammaproteobacteria bacterium]
MSVARWRRLAGLVCGFAALALLVVTQQLTNPMVLLGVRLALLALVVIAWRSMVNGLIGLGWVHPLRRIQVLAFRWHAAALMAVIELFVIGQVSQLIGQLVTR